MPPAPMKLATLLIGLTLLFPGLLFGQGMVERAELDAQIDPQTQTVYAKAGLLLRNPGSEPLDVIEFGVPAPLGSRTEVKSVWDRDGQLAWRSDPVEEKQPRTLQVALRSLLKPGKKIRLVVSFETNLEGMAAGAAASVSASGAQLATTGWYPLPVGSGPMPPESLRLTVRLPKEWRVVAPEKVKKIHAGTALTTYEIGLDEVRPEQILLRAGPGGPP